MITYNVSDKKTDIISRIKTLLYNYDLTLVYADKQIELRDKWMQLKKNKKGKRDAELYIMAKIEKERYLAFKEELKKERKELMEAILDVCVEYYGKKSKDIFYMYYFQQSSIREMIEQTGLEEKQIMQMIKRFEENLMYNVYE